MSMFEATDYLNVSLNALTLIILSGIANRIKVILSQIKGLTPKKSPNNQYTYWQVEPNTYRLSPCPPAYMYLDGIPGIESIRLEGKELLVKTTMSMESIVNILNSAIAIDCYYGNWFSDV